MDERANNLGLLRLGLAALVVIGHSAVLIDGDNSREPMTMLFGTISSGNLAVDGFFVVSGYLITKSFVATPTLTAYLLKRVARIVPGYVVSFAICVCVLAPLVGGTLSLAVLGDQIRQMVLLLYPTVPGVFDGLRHSNLNGSMWTIAYEFRCYVVTALLGLLGLYSRSGARAILLPLVLVLLALNASGAADTFSTGHETVRLLSVYGVGTLYFLFRDKVVFTRRRACLATALLLPLMFSPVFAEPAVAILGGYIIFWFAFDVRPRGLGWFDRKTDMSYGIYLYAWPIQNALIYWTRAIDPLTLCVASLCLSATAGYASWRIVEQPCLRLAAAKASRHVPPSPDALGAVGGRG